MNLFKFDVFSKVLISFTFRLVIILFGIYILFTQAHNNVFENYIYVFIIGIYITAYIKLLENRKATLRLLNDFLFIGLILFGKELTIISNLTFILLPFFNAPNHTDTNRNVLILSGVTCLTIYLLTFLGNTSMGFTYEYIDIIISLLIISLIIYFEQKRSLFLNKLFEVLELIDEKITPSNKITAIHDILKKIISIYNNEILKKIFSSSSSLNSIICIKVSSYITIQTGTIFVRKVLLDDSSVQRLKEAKNMELLSSIPITLDDKVIDKTMVLKIRLNRQSFYYFLLFDEKTSFKNSVLKYIVPDFFIPIFRKTSHRIIYEAKIKSTKRKQLSKLVENLDYVTTTNNSLHYLRNKFGPIQTYFDLLNDYDGIENEGKRVGLKKLIDRERKNAERAIIEVQNRASYILDKSNNPFEVKNLRRLKTKHIWMILIDSWKFIFKNDNGVFTNINDEDLNRYSYSVDTMLFDILITDIIINMSKHGSGNNIMDICLVDETKDLSISFKNDLSDNEEENLKLKKLVKHFNDDNRYEINRSSTHGFSQIKELSLRLNIDLSMSINSTSLISTLIIERNNNKGNNDENSNL